MYYIFVGLSNKYKGIHIGYIVLYRMFSFSSHELPSLPTFVNKVTQLIGEGAGEGSDAHPENSFPHLRSWCEENNMLVHYSKTPSGTFYILKYDRAKLKDSEYETVGRFRSVVFDSKGEICCIAPPKMLKLTDEMKTWSVNSEGGNLVAEELVEGMMVNLFYYKGTEKWYVATKSCVGEVSFDHIHESEAEAAAAVVSASAATTEVVEGARAYQKLNIQEILRRRICDVLSVLHGGLAAVPRQYCYSFVLQHPKNPIVNVITTPKLYLVAVYELLKGEGVGVGEVSTIRVNRDIFSSCFVGTVSHTPSVLTCVADETDAASATITPHTVEDYCRMYGSTETRSVSLPGVVFVDKDTGFCYKQRNPKYESVKKRKGVEQKLLIQYLQLRKDRSIDEHLKTHPQHSRVFNAFRERLHEYTLRLYDAYIDHYIKKNAKPLKEYDRELKAHMYKLHYDVYLTTMKEVGLFVTKHTVINYVNNLAAAQQLACLNGAGVGVGVGVGTGTGAGARVNEISSVRAPVRDSGSGTVGEDHRGFQEKRTEYNSNRGGSSRARGGFHSARPPIRGRSRPTLTIQIPSDVGATADATTVKGSKTSGSVKVQNQFAGLEVD